MEPLIIPAQPGWRIVDRVVDENDPSKVVGVALGDSIIAWLIVTEARRPKDIQEGVDPYWIDVTPVTCEGYCNKYVALQSPEGVVTAPYIAGPYSSFEEFRTVVASEPGLVS